MEYALKFFKAEDRFVQVITDWLFRRDDRPSPRGDELPVLWSVVPAEFVKEDQDEIKKRWLFEDI